MAKNSTQGNRERARRFRQRRAERGLTEIMVIAPPAARLLLKAASDLMTRDIDPVAPADALLIASGARQPQETNDDERIKELQEALKTEKANLARAQAQLAAAEAKATAIEADAACYAAVARRYKNQAEQAKEQAAAAEARAKAIHEASGLKGLALRVLSGV